MRHGSRGRGVIPGGDARGQSSSILWLFWSGPVRYALAFAGPYLGAVDVDGVNPAAVFDRAKPGGEPWEGEPVQFIDMFAGGTEADRSEQSEIAVRFFAFRMGN